MHTVLRSRLPAIPSGALRRGVIAGLVWGVGTAAGIVGPQAYDCGGICIPDAALTTLFAVGLGLITMGPLAAFGRRPTAPT